MQYGNCNRIEAYSNLEESLNRTMQYGNALSQRETTEQEKSLNRTMQYGNLPPAPANLVSGADSLNRTMQYGNFSVFHISFSVYLFKSYYVVWKRWQPSQKSSCGRTFKSYYVVWKLLYIVSCLPSQLGLNRTMQYGNMDIRNKQLLAIFCLNRTMQYGNFQMLLTSQQLTPV